MNIIYCSRCADVETPIAACFIDYGRSLCSPCFFELKGRDDAMRKALGDPDLLDEKKRRDSSK